MVLLLSNSSLALIHPCDAACAVWAWIFGGVDGGFCTNVELGFSFPTV